MVILSVAVPSALAAQTQEKPKEPPKEQPKEQPKEVSVSGTWDMTVQAPQGERPTTATFTQEKEVVKVSLSGPEGTINGEGTLKESAILFTITISGPNGDFSLFFKGKVEGDSMTGEIQMGDYGTMTWIAKKRK
jgi:hypothetical protein